MIKIIAIDPGNLQSAFVRVSDNGGDSFVISDKNILANNDLLNNLSSNVLTDTIVLIEMVESYGMPVGRTVFETVLWVGRFYQLCIDKAKEVKLVPRIKVKTHHCNSARAKDSNIIQVLKDKYGDKGTKKNPGFFYDFKEDIWQAFALASYYYEINFSKPKTEIIL